MELGPIFLSIQSQTSLCIGVLNYEEAAFHTSQHKSLWNVNNMPTIAEYHALLAFMNNKVNKLSIYLLQRLLVFQWI